MDTSSLGFFYCLTTFYADNMVKQMLNCTVHISSELTSKMKKNNDTFCYNPISWKIKISIEDSFVSPYTL